MHSAIILVIRGVVVTFDQMVKYLVASGQADEIIKFGRSWVSTHNHEEYDLKITEEMTQEEIVKEYSKICAVDCEFIDKFCGSDGNQFIHTWPCCSELANKKFVLGYCMGRISADDCITEMVTLEDLCRKKSGFSRDDEILTKLKLIGLEGPFHNICVPDSCTFCT